MSTSSYLLVNGQRIHYLHWGWGNRRTLLLLHGLASNARIWELAAPILAQSGYFVVAPDARNHGLSDKSSGATSFDGFFHDILALINVFEFERPLVVGHSWGALLALEYAVHVAIGPRSPAGLVLVDGAAVQLDAAGWTWEQVRDRLTPPKLAGLALDELSNRLEQKTRGWTHSKVAVQAYLANFEISADETVTPHLDIDTHMGLVRGMWDFKTYERYNHLRIPALLLLAGPSEPLPEAEQEYLRMKQKGASIIQGITTMVKVQWMQDAEHDLPLQRPADLVHSILDFAAGLSSRNGR